MIIDKYNAKAKEDYSQFMSRETPEHGHYEKCVMLVGMIYNYMWMLESEENRDRPFIHYPVSYSTWYGENCYEDESPELSYECPWTLQLRILNWIEIFTMHVHKEILQINILNILII